MQHLFLKRFVAVGIGGFFGGALRELLSLVIQLPMFPLATVIINLTGTFISAFLAVIWAKKITLAQPVADFIMIGVLGAYTTYSTAILDVVTHTFWISASYLMVQIIGGVLMVYLARGLANKVV